MEPKPKEIKILLQIMLDNIHMLETGLCRLNIKLTELNIITKKECLIIKYYLEKQIQHSSFFWWKLREIEPRVNWLKEHIKLLSS